MSTSTLSSASFFSLSNACFLTLLFVALIFELNSSDIFFISNLELGDNSQPL